MPDLSNLPISLSMITLLAQALIVGVFILMHFFLGVKRGVKKSLFYLIGHIGLVFLLLWLIGLFSLSWIFNEDNIREWFGTISLQEKTVNEYMDMLVQANALPLFFAIVDFVAKLVLFIVFYYVLRSLLTLVLYAWAWRFFKPSEDDDRPKQRLLGGLIGIVRGAFAGFIAIFPLMVLVNIVVGQGVVIENTEYDELATEISAANEYNFVKYVNMAKIGDVGIADFMFDLAFRSTVSGTDDTIIWRTELEWISEFAKAAAPMLLPSDSSQTGILDGEYTLDYEEFQGFRSAFDALAESSLIDSALAPGFAYGLDLIANEFPEVPETTLNYIKEAILESDISVINDLNTIFDAISELLAIQDLDAWMETFNDPKSILGFPEADQDHLKNAIEHFTSLSLFSVSDYALEFMLYTDEVKNEIKWVDEAGKAAYIDSIRDKIRAFTSEDSDTLIGATLIELGDLISTIAFDFPGVTVDDVTYDLVEFVDNIGNLMIVLNDDPEYHTWFQDTLTQVAGLSLFNTFLEELIGFGTNSISLGDAWTEEEMNTVKDIIRNNFADHEDLEAQFLWIADVYQAIGEFGVGPMFAENADMLIVFDDIMRGVDGPTKFNNLVDTLLAGQMITDLTDQMSDALIAKYIEDPMLREPFDKVMAIDGFSFIDEIETLANVIGQLYTVPSFSLADALAEGADPIDVLLPSLLEFVDSPLNRELVLSSDVIYALIDTQLGGIEEITVPDQVRELTGDYQGWIKRDELSKVLEIFVAMDIDTIPATQEDMDLLISDVLAFTSTVDNRNLVLSSDLIYFIISDQLLNLEIENFEIPDTAIESSGDYSTWIMRSELSKLLEALSILAITELPGAEGFPLDDITSVQLADVINLDSKILTRMITTQLKNAEIVSLPIPAFTDGTQADLTLEELQSIAQLLEELNLSLGILNEGGNTENLLNSISVAALTGVDYSESWIIRSFITYGITTALGSTTLHPLAVDSEYDTILSIDEIGALFDALDALDGGLDQTLNDLVDSLDPETMTVTQLSLVINVESILINEQVTLAVQDQFSLHTKALDSRTLDVEIPDLIAPTELTRLTDAIEVIDDGANQSITTLITALDPNTLTFGQTNAIIDIDSIIIRSVISENILEVELINELNIKDTAYEDNDPSGMLLSKVEVESMVNALNHLAATPDDAVMPVVDGLDPQTISLGVVSDMVAEGSLVLRTLISDELKSTDGFEIHPDALDSDSDVNQSDLDDLFTALSVSLGEDLLIADLAGLASSITMGQIMTFNAQVSLIKDGMISKMVIDNIPGGKASVRTHAYDSDDLLKPVPFGLLDTVEITNMFNALYALSGNDDDAILLELTQSISDTSTITLSQVTDVVSQSSIIINSMVSENVIPTLEIEKIHPDALEENATPDEVLTVTEIKRPDMVELMEALEASLGGTKTIDDLTDLATTITIGEVMLLDQQTSLIKDGLISKMLVDNIPGKEASVRTSAYDAADLLKPEPFGLIDTTEITRMFNSLFALSGSDSNALLFDLSQSLADTSTITLAQVTDAVSEESIVINSILSENIIPILTLNKIHPDALEDNTTPFGGLTVTEIKRTDMKDLMVALEASLGGTKTVDDLTDLTSTITIGQIMTLNQQVSVIKDGLVSKMIVESVPGGAATVRTHAYDALDQAKPDPFGMLDASEITNVFDAMYLLSGSDDAALLNSLMTSLSNTAAITIGQVTNAVSEQSIIINSIISENLIPILVLSDIHPTALEDNTTPDVVGTITEIKRPDMVQLFSALQSLDANATLDDLQTILGDTLTIAQIQTMRAENSVIFEGKVSKIIESTVTANRVVDDAYVVADPFGLIKPLEITNLLLALDEFAGGGAIGNASSQLANEASDLSVAELESIHGHNSYIIRYFISEGILVFADPNINEDAYEVGYVDEYYTAAEITRIINSIKVLTNNDPDAELQTVITGMTPGSVESAKLAQLFPSGNYSYVIQRKTSIIINSLDLSGLGISVPESAYVDDDSMNVDIKDSEFRAMSNALVALGFTTLEINNITAESTPIANVKAALEEDSVLVNRIISKAIVDAGLDTAESHLGTEDPNVDIQVDEMINMTDAFIALGIDDIDGATGTNPTTLIGNAQSMDRTEFRGYIDYAEADESLGLTLVKEFLYDLLDDIYENPFLYPTHDDLDTRVELDTFVYDEF